MGSSQLHRLVGLLFAAAALAGTALWLVTGAAVPLTLTELSDEAVRTGTLYISVHTNGKQPEADAVSARLLAEGYPSFDTKQGLRDWYGHNLVIDRPFTQQEALPVAARLGREFPGKDVSIGPRYELTITGETRRGHVTFSYVVYAVFLSLHGDAMRVGMWAAATETIVAAVLALWLLLRRRHSQEVVRLGFSLGCISLYAFYLTLYSVAPVFAAYQPPGWPLRIALDVIAIQLVVAGFYAFTKFWAAFPRVVPRGELEAFLQARRALQLKQLGAARPAARTQVIGDSAKLAILVVLGLITGLLWTGGFMLPGFGPELAIQLSFGTFLLVVVYWQGLTCLRLFSYHRANGSAEDRRKIEWVWAALWMAFIVLLAPLAALAAFNLGSLIVPELSDWSDYALVADIVSWSVAPTLLFVAIALSIQYRGSVDPKLALRGFTVWTVLSIVLTLIFVFVERTVALRLVGWWHLPPQTGLVTAGAIVAATFQPIRRQLEKRVSRFVERVLPASLLAAGVRQVRAVAVVDISGYTALSARDEQAALLASALVQKEARRLTDVHGGKLVKSTGDGAILCFEEAYRALETVKDLHAGVRSGAAALNIPDLKLHSGLHWGEVVEMHDGDIYGMTVNVASRVADWARAGEIGVSRTFHDQLASPTREFQDAGPQSFKNVPEPVGCLKLPTA